MMNIRGEKIGAAFGIVFVILLALGLRLQFANGVGPSPGAPAAEIVAYFRSVDPSRFELGIVVLRIAVVPLLLFLGSLWSLLKRGEARLDWLAQAAFGSGIVYAALVYSRDVPVRELLRAADSTPEVVAMVWNSGSSAYGNTWIVLSLMMLTAGIAMIKNQAIPGWVGWLSVILAFPVWGPRAMGSSMMLPAFGLLALWVIVTSVILIRLDPAEEPERASV